MPNPPNRSYPAMSHPVADPAVAAVAARFAGLRAADPSHGKILEIGCATGHHLLPLAMRWPEARCTGIDLSEDAIDQARALAAAAGLGEQASFHPLRLEDFHPENGPYEVIIAHGFFSWVEESTRHFLLDFCRQHLVQNGLAIISFNVTAGWEHRMTIVRKARALREAVLTDNDWDSLQALRAASTDHEDLAVIDDMLAKGADVLAYDDFAPINEPCRLDEFVSLASSKGLRWLGESCVSENQPRTWTPEDEEARQLLQRQCTPLELHQWMDECSERTFRSALLCRDDANTTGKMKSSDLDDIHLRFAQAPAPTQAKAGMEIATILRSHWPSTVPLGSLKEAFHDPHEFTRDVCHGLIHGRWSGSCHPLELAPHAPNYPRLDPLRMACAKRRLPLVDACHQPCTFVEEQWQFLEWMDGTRAQAKLEEMIRETSPRVDFSAWLHHLHERGLLMPRST